LLVTIHLDYCFRASRRASLSPSSRRSGILTPRRQGAETQGRPFENPAGIPDELPLGFFSAPWRLCDVALIQKRRLCKGLFAGYLAAMSTVQEIEAAIPKLSRAELEQFHAWYEDFLEDHLELTDDVKAELDESRREIAAGNYTTRQRK
jgi:hypothetical protein